MRVLAVAMLDVATMGRDVFWLETEPGRAMQYEVRKDGVQPLLPEAVPLALVDSSVEKFHHGYRLASPLEVKNPAELTKYLGAFEIQDTLTCELRR